MNEWRFASKLGVLFSVSMITACAAHGTRRSPAVSVCTESPAFSATALIVEPLVPIGWSDNCVHAAAPMLAAAGPAYRQTRGGYERRGVPAGLLMIMLAVILAVAFI